MAFVQTIAFKTSRIDEMQALVDEYARQPQSPCGFPLPRVRRTFTGRLLRADVPTNTMGLWWLTLSSAEGELSTIGRIRSDQPSALPFPSIPQRSSRAVWIAPVTFFTGAGRDYRQTCRTCMSPFVG